MSTYSLRKAGGSVMVTVPLAYLKRTGLKAGSAVTIDVRGNKLIITPAMTRVTLAAILKASPKDIRELRAEGWDDMPAVGKEAWRQSSTS